MKKLLFFVLTLGLIFVAGRSSAQQGMRWNGSGGWGMGAPYGRIYDPATVETVSGVVEKVEKITPIKGMSYGVHLVVKAGDQAVDVHLGPAWFVENQDVKIAAGDRVEVKGSKVTFRNRPAIIAAEVKKGDEALKLRDENGFPVWAGWRRR